MNTSSLSLAALAFVLAFLLVGCQEDQRQLFERRSPSHTGITFANAIVQDDTLINPLDFLYLYNGGGVAAGDVNGDNRPDLYFAGNQVDNRLYLNQGEFQFRDVTKTASVQAENVWATGISMVDINQDGLMDLYVSVGGPKNRGPSRANQLFVNQGLGADSIPTFEEKAEEYGIANTGYTTHAAFFDYDQDGDLDLYVLNNAMEEGYNRLHRKRTEGQAPNTDHLYRNNGDGTFTDVSEEAGIQIEGYGLGVGITDINKDGWPDIYVGNDFISNDVFYINNGDGTFTNRIDRYVKHQAYSAMGVDLADFTNDTRVDIMVLDMLPWSNPRLRMVPKSYEYPSPRLARHYGYAPQYVRNTLQLNNGMSPAGHLTFSEISQLAGVDATGWSWAPLFADFDNDGDRDLFVSNGYGKDVTNLDFVYQRPRMEAFGTAKSNREKMLKATRDLSSVRLPNRFFENTGPPDSTQDHSLRFIDKSETWTSPRPGISNGAAVADLDGDGDLDLVTNNLNAEPTVLENRASERDSSHSLRIRLHGPTGNRAGFGTKLTLYNNGTTQYHDHSTYRGYQSTVSQVVHFGLGADSTADSLEVVWPDDERQVLTGVEADRVLDLHYEDATSSPSPGNHSPAKSTEYLLREVAEERGLTYRHEDASRDNPTVSPLVPHVYTRNDPGIAVGDVNGDGLDDVFVGADREQDRALFLQTEAGDFEKRTLSMNTRFSDMGALFFDADGDDDLDLYVASGGDAEGVPRSAYQDRLYLNDGSGQFQRAPAGVIPEMNTSSSVVTAADYDQDGDLDLFVGGRIRPGSYPLPPRSYLLRNDSDDGETRFTDVTSSVAPDLAEAGLVTDALWTDYDTDGDRDLMVVGEWMPITIFENENGQFTNVTDSAGLEDTSGWWNSLAAGDFDRDGDTDYIAGNLGLNTKYEASPSEPVSVHAKDYNNTGDIDAVLSRYVDGVEVPAHSRDALLEQLPGMKARFETYRAYGNATFDDLFTSEELDGAYVQEAVRFETSYVENQGDGTFSVRELPIRTQTAPVFGIRSGDYNGDGHLDLLMIGNWYAPSKQSGQADAFIGAYLRGDGTGHFSYVNYTESGFFVDGDGKGLAEVATGDGRSLILAAQNDGPLKAFTRPAKGKRKIEVRPDDRYATLHFENGDVQRREFYFGTSYLSQSSRMLLIPPTVEGVTVYGADGRKRTVTGDSPSSDG